VTTNPFGRYSDILTTFVAAFVIVAAVMAHMFPALAGTDTQFVDAAAWIALGSLFGKVSAANGYANMAIQAHRRLDLIGAPPATDGHRAPDTGATAQGPSQPGNGVSLSG